MIYKTKKKIVLTLLTFVLVIFVMFPIFWMARISITPKSILFSRPVRILPSQITFKTFGELFNHSKFLKYYMNSIIVAVGTILLCSFTSILAAYSFSRFSYKGKKTLMLISLTSQMFPAALLILSLYLLYQKIGLINSYQGLILAHSSFALPLSIWIIKSYFDTIPKELEDSAKMDGLGKLKSLFYIIIPLSYPGIIAATIYIFIYSWNDFIFGLTLTTQDKFRILAPGISLTFMGQMEYLWSEMMSASILTSLPIVIAFLFLQKYFVKGLTAGAVKQ